MSRTVLLVIESSSHWPASVLTVVLCIPEISMDFRLNFGRSHWQDYIIKPLTSVSRTVFLVIVSTSHWPASVLTVGLRISEISMDFRYNFGRSNWQDSLMKPLDSLSTTVLLVIVSSSHWLASVLTVGLRIPEISMDFRHNFGRSHWQDSMMKPLASVSRTVLFVIVSCSHCPASVLTVGLRIPEISVDFVTISGAVIGKIL